ncbi:phenylpyruvate tautomerase MIF-related protein, partial [Thiohalocapsa halophila]
MPAARDNRCGLTARSVAPARTRPGVRCETSASERAAPAPHRDHRPDIHPQQDQRMPTLIIKTNADLPPSPRDDLLKAASAAVAELLGKPEGYVMVLVEPVADMSFGADS